MTRNDRNPPPSLVGAKWSGDMGDVSHQVPLVRFKDASWSGRRPTRRWRRVGNRPFAVDGGVIEPLYHATVACSEIFEHGFKTGKELGRAGLGSGDDRDYISLSQDISLVCRIASCLKQAIRIARGDIVARDVVDMAARLSILEETFMFAKMHGVPQKEPDESWSFFLYRLCDIGESDYLNDRQLAWALYRSFLYAAHMAKKAIDPLFMTSIESFENYDINDVGLLKCRLDNAVWYPRSMIWEMGGKYPKGCFVYLGHGRQGMPDSDEFRVYDVSSLKVVGFYDCPS